MTHQTLKQKLLEYINNNGDEWHKKVSLYLIADELGYSPETAGRKLRELEQEGKIKVDYYNGKYSKHLARYASNGYEEKTPKLTIVELPDGSRVAKLISGPGGRGGSGMRKQIVAESK